MKIYRMENDEKLGAFSGLTLKQLNHMDDLLEQETGRHYTPPFYPATFAENWERVPSMSIMWNTGTQSPELFNEWFPPRVQKYLKRHKQLPHIYEVPRDKVILGKRQALYQPEFAKEINDN